ncbi:MAG: hypothetical protein Q8O24_01155 [Gallionellaceae bacterium]|nr:hypothetical protein [Gallionellaceae bacterium]
MDTLSSAEKEKRRHHQIRGIFIKACELLEPVVTGNDTLKTVSSFAMAHMVQDHFPELTPAEAHIVVVTVEKMHHEQRLQAILKKQS